MGMYYIFPCTFLIFFFIPEGRKEKKKEKTKRLNKFPKAI